jgi:glucoamylase
VWHRYNGDGYGEHEDGRPFDGTGIGRGWPLLVGERAHFELARGNEQEARRLCQVMAGQSSAGGLIPEQIWDAEDIRERGLLNGRPAGSAMPLVWAHAEHIKLQRSLRDRRVFDMPPQTVQRYQVDTVAAKLAFWRFNHKCHQMPPGKVLRIEALTAAIVHWSVDDWRTVGDTQTTNTHLGIHFADVPTDQLPAARTVRFTFFWIDANRWEGEDFEITVAAES